MHAFPALSVGRDGRSPPRLAAEPAATFAPPRRAGSIGGARANGAVLPAPVALVVSDRTAYPRFKRVVSAQELAEAFTPTPDEVAWARDKTQSDPHLRSGGAGRQPEAPCPTACIASCSWRASSASWCVGWRSNTTSFTVPVNAYGALSS